MEINLNWTDFKEEVNSRSIPLQSIEQDSFYLLIAFDGNLGISCKVPKDDSADHIDFETNYKNLANKSPIQQKPFADAIGFRARLTGITGIATSGQVTNIDYKFTEPRFINGGKLILKNHVMGDSLKFQIVDKDNVFGYGSGIVLDEFVSNWNVAEDKQDQGDYLVSYLARVPTNIYLRLAYTSTGETDVAVALNLYLHKKD